MISENWLKATSEKVEITLTTEMIQTYAKAIGETELLYKDLEVAKSLGYQDIPAPPTLPIIFWQFIDVPWLENVGPVIHGKQRFLYKETLIANRNYDCMIQLTNLTYKMSKNRRMQRSEHELSIYRKNKLHATAVSTLIIFDHKENH